MRIQFWHIVVLLLVVLLLFGSSKLPDLARSIGKSMKILKTEVGELRDEGPSSSPPPARGDQPPVGSRNAAPPRSTDRPGEDPHHRDPEGGDPGPRDR